MKVTIFMPVSRDEYLDSIFARLEMLECKREDVNLLVIVDGDVDLFVKTRNFVEMSKFAERLCVQFKTKHKLRHYDTLGRRFRIADIHNLSKEYMVECDYVFGIEDDTIIPTNALAKLLKDYSLYPHAGFIQGVQLGRWGIPYVGAWKVDDIYDVKNIESLSVSTGITEIDGGGFYCYITKSRNYMEHEYKVFEANLMGPDFNYGIELRRVGLMNYIDWSISTTHKSKKGDISVFNTDARTATLKKVGSKWIRKNF